MKYLKLEFDQNDLNLYVSTLVKLDEYMSYKKGDSLILKLEAESYMLDEKIIMKFINNDFMRLSPALFKSVVSFKQFMFLLNIIKVPTKNIKKSYSIEVFKVY